MSVQNNFVFLLSVTVVSLFATGIHSREVTVFTIDQNRESPAVPEHNGGVVPLEMVVVSERISKSEAAINAIHQDASASIKSGASSSVVSEIEEGLKAAIELIVASSDAAAQSLASARKIANQNPEAAIRTIGIGMRTAQGLIRAVEIPIYYSLDFGNGSTNWKQNYLKVIQKGVKYAVSSLSVAETVSNNSLRSNSAAIGKGLEATEEVAMTGFDAIYESLIQGGRSVFKVLSDEATGPQQVENAPICTARTETPSAEAKAAANEITLRAKEARQSVNQSSVANAISKIENVLICGITTIASGEASMTKSILIAKELSSDEPEIAIASFKAGLKALKNGVIEAGNLTSQGLIEVEHSLGNQTSNKFRSTISKIQNVTRSTCDGLKTAEKMPSIGFKMGGPIAAQGLRAFYKSVSALLFEFYFRLVKIAEEAF